MTFRDLYLSLCHQYTEGEAKAVVRLLLEEKWQLSFTDLYTGGLDQLSEADRTLLLTYIERLKAAEPIQYILGYATFMGRLLKVNKHVLIPRPETEYLCSMLIQRYDHPFCALQPPQPLRMLDIGTGSGCIAISLALALKNSEVTAWDISGDALLVARENAHLLQAKVSLEQHDMLHEDEGMTKARTFDLIVSNPPYVCHSEKKEMAAHVLQSEPHQALFVSDEDPLVFYRTIGQYARHHLNNMGCLAFEINPLFSREMVEMLQEQGYQDVECIDDQFGKHRFVLAKFVG